MLSWTCWAQRLNSIRNNYLDLREDPNGNLVELFVYVLGASLIVLLLYCVALLDEQHERRKRGKTAEAEL